MSNINLIGEIDNLLKSGDEEKIYKTFFHFLSNLKELEKDDDYQYRIFEAAEWILEGNIEESMNEVYESIDHVVAERMSQIKQFIKEDKKESDSLSFTNPKKDLRSVISQSLLYRNRIKEFFEDIAENISISLINHGDCFSYGYNGPVELVLWHGGNGTSFYLNEDVGIDKFLELYLDDNVTERIKNIIENQTL